MYAIKFVNIRYFPLMEVCLNFLAYQLSHHQIFQTNYSQTISCHTHNSHLIYIYFNILIIHLKNEQLLSINPYFMLLQNIVVKLLYLLFSENDFLHN